MTFEEFAAAQLPAVLRFAAVLAGDRAAAEDLAQEVLIRAYSRWDTIGTLDRPGERRAPRLGPDGRPAGRRGLGGRGGDRVDPGRRHDRASPRPGPAASPG